MEADTKLVGISLIVTRNSLIPDFDKIRSCMEKQFDTNVQVSYICDICHVTHDITNNLCTVHCSKCDKYYDHCKFHDNISECPLCIIKNSVVWVDIDGLDDEIFLHKIESQ